MLASNRAQVSAHHTEHVPLGLGRASWKGCLASGKNSDATFSKTLTRTTEVHWKVNIFPIFNHFLTICTKKIYLKQVHHRGYFVELHGCGATCLSVQVEWALPRQEEQVGESKQNLDYQFSPDRLLSSSSSVVASLLDLHWWQSLLESQRKASCSLSYRIGLRKNRYHGG